jgi:hypothetical protein
MLLQSTISEQSNMQSNYYLVRSKTLKEKEPSLKDKRIKSLVEAYDSGSMIDSIEGISDNMNGQKKK